MLPINKVVKLPIFIYSRIALMSMKDITLINILLYSEMIVIGCNGYYLKHQYRNLFGQ